MVDECRASAVKHHVPFGRLVSHAELCNEPLLNRDLLLMPDFHYKTWKKIPRLLTCDNRGEERGNACCAQHCDGFNCASNPLLVFLAEGRRHCAALCFFFFFPFAVAGMGSLFDNVDTIVSTLLSASPSVASSDSADHYAYSKQAEGANSSLISAQKSSRRLRLMPGGEEGGHQLNTHVYPRPKSVCRGL